MDSKLFEILREELKKQVEPSFYPIDGKLVEQSRGILEAIPYLNDKDSIRFLYCGLEITLNNNGTWDWEDTTGG